MEEVETEIPVDDKGRIQVDHLSDRAIAEETLVLLRAFADFMQAMSSNPMMRAISEGKNPMGAMIGGLVGGAKR